MSRSSTSTHSTSEDNGGGFATGHGFGDTFVDRRGAGAAVGQRRRNDDIDIVIGSIGTEPSKPRRSASEESGVSVLPRLEAAGVEPTE